MRTSPFSLSCNYTVTPAPFVPRPPGVLTEREEIAIDLIQTCGAAAVFQLEYLWGANRTRKKLKTLARCGLLARTVLQGDYRISVYTPDVFPGLDEALRSMAFLQLYLRFRELGNVRATREEYPLFGKILVGAAEYPVAVIRSNDDKVSIPLLFKDLPRLIIISEQYDPVFSKIEVPCRIVLDTDLLDKPGSIQDLFILPNGEPEGVSGTRE